MKRIIEYRIVENDLHLPNWVMLRASVNNIKDAVDFYQHLMLTSPFGMFHLEVIYEEDGEEHGKIIYYEEGEIDGLTAQCGRYCQGSEVIEIKEVCRELDIRNWRTLALRTLISMFWRESVLPDDFEPFVIDLSFAPEKTYLYYCLLQTEPSKSYKCRNLDELKKVLQETPYGLKISLASSKHVFYEEESLNDENDFYAMSILRYGTQTDEDGELDSWTDVNPADVVYTKDYQNFRDRLLAALSQEPDNPWMARDRRVSYLIEGCKLKTLDEMKAEDKKDLDMRWEFLGRWEME